MVKPNKDQLLFRTVRGISVNYRWLMTKYDPHYHSAGEFTLALNDDCKYRVEGEDITLNKNDILLVWPNEVHESIYVPHNSSLLVHFTHTLIENNLDLVSHYEDLKRYHKIDSKVYPRLAESIAKRMFEIRDYYDNISPFSESKCKAKMLEIFVLIAEHSLKEQSDDRVASIESASDRKHIKAALTYIDEHFCESISQTDVAEYVGLSPYYFSRLFKKYMKNNLSTYIAHLRINKASGLLADESISITECAFQSGFQSITAFNRVFKEQIGCSPRVYRQNCVKNKKS